MVFIRNSNLRYLLISHINNQDGKPYILSVKGSKLYDDPRSKGYTFAAQTSFSDLDDMNYYDNECEAHKTLKANMGPRVTEPPMTLYMDA